MVLFVFRLELTKQTLPMAKVIPVLNNLLDTICDSEGQFLQVTKMAMSMLFNITMNEPTTCLNNFQYGYIAKDLLLINYLI